MVKGMRYREIEQKLLSEGCKWRNGKGSHINWYCPCGQHHVSVDKHTHVSPGVVRDIIKKLTCLPEGWLQ